MIHVVDVALPVPLRQTFTYKIPQTVDPTSVQPGHRVLAPFRAKLVHGVTMTAAYTADVEQRKQNLRFLATYDLDERILAPEIERLAHWIERYYRGPIGEIVKMALPPGLLSEKEIQFRLTEAGAAKLTPDNPDAGGGVLTPYELPETRLLRLLDGKTLTQKAWSQLAQTDIKLHMIRDWEDAGWLEIVASDQGKESIPHVTAFRLTDKGREYPLEALKRAPKQQALLAWLHEHRSTGYFTTADLDHKTTHLTSLEARDLVQRLRIPKHELDRQVLDFEPDEVKTLTDEQDTALKAVNQALDTQAFQPFLMFGVTGAGKTEVYLRAIQHCLAQNRQALFLVPEIGLTPLMQRRIVDRFGDRLAILHSAVGVGRRNEAWARILSGKVDVVLGARSGIFAPLPRLGLVIVDEEHDQSYKQNDGVRYHARDLALVRAKDAKAVVVLGSATPSLESWRNQDKGRSHLLTLKHRATKAPLPTVEIIDMREEFRAQRGRPIISRMLDAKIEHQLGRGRQVMILLNRRGYHSFMLCRKCGEAVTCDDCDVTLTFHQTDQKLHCHYCDVVRPVPERCPSCDEPAAMLQFFGEGTQQIQELLQKRFPDHRVDRLDRDRIGGRKDAHQQILADFERNRSHILVGTQMIAKGHDFPNVTLVGIINADIGLRVPDFRSAETVFQLITQVAGRSGRGKNPGSVVIQTYMPDHYAVTCAAKHDFLAFLGQEMRYREGLFYPPFAHMIAILLTHQDETLLSQAGHWLAHELRNQQGLIVLGPAKAPIGKIKGAHRHQLVLKSADRQRLHHLTDAVISQAIHRKILPASAVIMDIDPYQFF